MSELDDNIEKRVLAQKILDADSLHDALEYIRKRYNVDIPVVQEHRPEPEFLKTYSSVVTRPGPRPVMYNFRRYHDALSRPYIVDRPEYITMAGSYGEIDDVKRETEAFAYQRIVESSVLKVETNYNVAQRCIDGAITFDIPKMMIFDQFDSNFEKV